MAEPFKNLVSPATVEHMAHHLGRVTPGFDAARFSHLALENQPALELKARILRIADALQATLPADFSDACDAIEAALASPLPLDERGELVAGGAALRTDGLSGWSIWALGEWVARNGVPADARLWPRALACLHALTQRSTAEFAIRPFLQSHPDRVWPTLMRWSGDPSAHVRRLASEGSRPRLPWGLRLQALVADPAPTLPLLQALQDDPSSYVRRSVANHLNDIARDHPTVVSDWLQRHLPDAPTPRRALLRHASRGLIKAGHGPTLSVWGLGMPLQGRVGFALDAAQAAIGTGIGLRVDLVSTADRPQALEIDYAVHHARQQGGHSVKVFKGWRCSLGPQAVLALEKRHSLREVTTRRLWPGQHRIELRINGQTVAEAGFELMAA
ncbi:DNA alkylation repair protein [uncultured Hydrogenophaga sp.]|uniref:DNA alkylation repair protein n=1 Tax=uncultured Hydrogenophaga sp. TaxID=199683 RepID=UPI00265F8120|nr:DNA alkylation repair protein [uncultured Hydrogenophaga sp.]